MKCWSCHSNSVNTGSRLPRGSDVKTRKRRNVVGIDMIRNNRIVLIELDLFCFIVLFIWLFWIWNIVFCSWYAVLFLCQKFCGRYHKLFRILFRFIKLESFRTHFRHDICLSLKTSQMKGVPETYQMKGVPETYQMKGVPETYQMKGVPETHLAHLIRNRDLF